MFSFRKDRQPGRARVAAVTWVGFVLGLGVVLITVGTLIDVAYHLWWSADEQRAAVGLVGHLVTLAGMVTTMVAVAATGLRSSARANVKGELHARRRPAAP